MAKLELFGTATLPLHAGNAGVAGMANAAISWNTTSKLTPTRAQRMRELAA